MDRGRLKIYLNDHVAALCAVESRARRSAEVNDDPELVAALVNVAEEAAEDREALLAVMRKLGMERSRLKELSALLFERAGRLKLNGRLVRYSPLSRIEELEFLAIGVSLSERMWETLELLRKGLPQLDEMDVSERRIRSRVSEENLLQLRRQWVEVAFM